MHKYFSLTFYLIQACCGTTVAQLCRLNSQYEESTSRVILDWNMINHPAKTTYILLRSTDTKTWIEVVTDKILRKYTEEDIFDYDDKVNRDQKYYYKLKIVDANNKTAAFSNTVTISAEADKRSWVIYPNPVNDVLYLVYEGNNIIKGVINATVQDITGKIVTRFRAASTSRRLEIPVSNLRKGIYIAQISTMNEIIMNQKFVKQ
ncbi:MAG: T9SS type A sorting domain-containing protein [Ginsengibacter sp.]